MALEQFLATYAAVVVANVLSGVFLYGLWRATKVERRLGVTNGGDFLPLWLLIVMIIGPALMAWGMTQLY